MTHICGSPVCGPQCSSFNHNCPITGDSAFNHLTRDLNREICRFLPYPDQESFASQSGIIENDVGVILDPIRWKQVFTFLARPKVTQVAGATFMAATAWVIDAIVDRGVGRYLTAEQNLITINFTHLVFSAGIFCACAGKPLESKFPLYAGAAALVLLIGIILDFSRALHVDHLSRVEYLVREGELENWERAGFKREDNYPSAPLSVVMALIVSSTAGAMLGSVLPPVRQWRKDENFLTGMASASFLMCLCAIGDIASRLGII